MAEPAFRIKKLDVVIALLAGHIALDVTNPGLIAVDNLFMRAIATVSVALVTVLISAFGSRT